VIVPDVLKLWTLANPDLKRTPACFNHSLKTIEILLKYICNPMVFSLADPAPVTRDMINALEDQLKVVELTIKPEKDLNKVTVKKVMIYTAQGTGDQTTYQEFMKEYDQKIEE
jgi:hypothetical protein